MQTRYDDTWLLGYIIDCIGNCVLVMYVAVHLFVMIVLALVGFGGVS